PLLQAPLLPQESGALLLPLHKVHVGGNFLIQAHWRDPSFLCCGDKQKSLRPGQTGRKPGFRYTTHSVSSNTRPGNGGDPARLTGSSTLRWARGSGGMRQRLPAPASTSRRLSAALSTLRLSPSWPFPRSEEHTSE